MKKMLFVVLLFFSLSGNAIHASNSNSSLIKNFRYVEINAPLIVMVDGIPVDFPYSYGFFSHSHGWFVPCPENCGYTPTAHMPIVAMRFVVEALGFDVHWNEETQTVSFLRDDYVVTITIGYEFFYLNDVRYENYNRWAYSAEIFNNRVMLPLTQLIHFGYAIEKLPEGNTFNIVKCAYYDNLFANDE